MDSPRWLRSYFNRITIHALSPPFPQEHGMQEQPKLKDLLEFPCQFTYKVMGYAKPELPDLVLSVIQKHAPGDYSPSI